jgi:uncharacterized protein (TIGR03437 family)
MLNRFSYSALMVFVATLSTAVMHAGSAAPGTGLLFQLPGIGSTSGQFIGYTELANPLNPSISATGPVGTTQVIIKPDGSKFYMIGTTVQSIDGAFSTAPVSINGMVGPPTAAAISPDGTRLLVGASDTNSNGFLYVISTATDQIVATLSLPSVPNFAPGTSGFCASCWIAFTPDSKNAFVLTNSGVGSRVTDVSLTTNQQIGQLSLNGGATSIGISPLGLLYVTAVNLITEINPANLTVTPAGPIQLFFSPGRLRFTPDGTTAYAANLVPGSGGSVLQVNLASHGTETWPPFTPGVVAPLFDDILIAGNNRIFATSSQNQTLFDITASPLSASPSAVTVGQGGNQLTVLATAISSELPVSQNLFLLVANGNQTLLYRINLLTNTVSAQVLATSIFTDMQFVTVPDTAGASTFLQFNNNQTLTAGGISAPLIAQVLDANGFPVFGVATSFTTDPTNGATIANAAPVTNANGFVSTTVTIPNVGATYTITLTAGSASTTYTLTVPGGVGGGTTGSGSSQVQIVSGNGQLFQENTSTAITGVPLTLRVTDTNGNPLPNVPVTWAIAPGTLVTLNYLTLNGQLVNTGTQTDANGLVSSDFFASTIPLNLAFEVGAITATTAYGTATFTETIIHLNGDGSGQPEFDLLAPTSASSFTITAGQGTPLPGAVQVRISVGNFPQTGTPIPGVGLTLQNGADPTQPSPAQCQGSSLSDSNGLASCTLVAACHQGNFPLSIQVGNFRQFQNIDLNVVAGGASQLNIIGGNNQAGTAGQTLPQPLTATLTDGCGSAVSGGTVTWTITQGSATLVNEVTSSDSQGRVSTRVTLGQQAGPITVKVATANGITATFTLTNQVIVASVAVVSGNGQIGIINQAFAQPVVFIVKDNNGNPVVGITVNFSLVSGSGSVNPASATTGANGEAQTTVTAGATPGNIGIQAAAAGLTTTAVLVSQPMPATLTASSFVNAASFQPGLAVCGLATVRGNGIAPNITGVVSGLSAFGPLPYTLGGVSLTVNGLQAPIESVANENGTQQATFQVPCELAPGAATVVVTVNGSNTTVQNVPVFAAQPGIFTFQGANGKVYGAVQSASNGSYVTPTNFAVRGQTYYLIVTGMGQTLPATATDSGGIANQSVALQVVVGVNNAGVPVVSATYQEGQIGVYLIGFQIPLTAPTGPDQNLAVAVIVNGQTIFGNGVLIGGVM